MRHLNGINLPECFNKTVIPVCFALLFAISSVSGQTFPADSAILGLKEGILVIRLPMQERKLTHLRNGLEKATDPKSRTKWEKLIRKTEDEKNEMVRDYTKAFKDHYTFSSFAFVYDNEIRDMILRDTTMNALSTPFMSKDKMFYLFFERTDDSKSNAMIIHSPDKRAIRNPFPSTYATGGINKLWSGLTGSNFAESRVKVVDKKLKHYYAYVQQRKLIKS